MGAGKPPASSEQSGSCFAKTKAEKAAGGEEESRNRHEGLGATGFIHAEVQSERTARDSSNQSGRHRIHPIRADASWIKVSSLTTEPRKESPKRYFLDKILNTRLIVHRHVHTDTPHQAWE